MENKLIDRLSKSLSDPMPIGNNLDASIDKILPRVRQWSEDLREHKFYLSKPWLEFRDDDSSHATILHFFNEDGEYLRSVDGDVSSGTWRYLEKSNKMLLSGRNKAEAELFDLAFLDNQLFILRKHGDQERHHKPSYFVMVYEPLGKKLEWREVTELLFNKAQGSTSFYILLTFIIILVLVMFLLLR